MRVALALLSLLSCVHSPRYPSLLKAPEHPPSSILIRDVRVFRGTTPQAEEHLDVLVAGGKIAEVRSTGPASQAELVIDGRGLTLLPGFIDMHAHLTYTAAPPASLTMPRPEHNAEAHVCAGVTTVLDAGGDTDDILALQRKIAEGRLVGPRIYFSGPHLTVPGGYPLDMIRDVYGRMAYWSLEGSHARGFTTATGLLAEIDRLHGLGARFIKLMVATIPPSGAPRLSDEMVRAAVIRAHAHGMKVAAHIDTADDALICARAGVDLLAHGIEPPAVSEQQAREIAASGIFVEATLGNFERFDELAAGPYQGWALERESEPAALLVQFSDEKLRERRPALDKTPVIRWANEVEK